MMAKQKSVEPTDTYIDYLRRNDVRQQMSDCLLKLIGNKPDNPMLFMADYFDSYTDKSNKVSNALRMLAHAQKYPSVFEANLLRAYEDLCFSKSCASKKSTKPGLLGSVFETFLFSILSISFEEIKTLFLKKMICRSNEVIPFDVFRYGVYASFLFNDYVAECKQLYDLFCNKHSNTSCDKSLCDVMFNSYQSALNSLANQNEKVLEFFNATLQLSSQTLAFDMLNVEEKKFDHCAFSEKDFLLEMTEMFLGNLKTFH